MKASPTYLLDALSNNDVTFSIPPYQRNYEWAVENCKVLFSDILSVATANLSASKTEHFFGSIVYVVEDAGFGVPSKYVLTDGQQRITTTMLLLMALRDSISDEAYRSAIQRRYLQNDRADSNVEYKIKLKQVESDWEAYKVLALEGVVPESLRNSAVYQNYSYFHRALADLDEVGRKSLLEQGLTKFSIIAIQLEPDRNPWENPQEIFESMNSLGRPLSLADLVRNYLLMGKSSGQQGALYSQFWLPLEKRLPGRLSEFIRDWMQVDQHRSFKVARETNYKELYGSFKAIVQGRGVEDLFQSFVRFSRPYSIVCGVEGSGDEQIDRILADLNIIGVVPAYSYLSEILASWEDGHLSTGETREVLAAFRTYLLRRRVLGLTLAENKAYPPLGGKLPLLHRSEDKATALLSQLSSQEYALRLPNDDELTARLRSMNFYNLGKSRNYPRLLLSMAEEFLTKARPAWDDPKLQLEHIMPQKLNSAWRAELGEDADLLHQEYVNNLGNITLIRHNQELGNKVFLEKRKAYQGKSGLQVTQNCVLDQGSWAIQSIERRRDYLIEMFVSELVPVPRQFKRASNWNLSGRDESSFDSRQALNQLIGEEIHYVANPLITATVVSDSKVSFEGGEWALGPLTKMIKERSGVAVSKASNFHGASNWSWGGRKLVDLDF